MARRRQIKLWPEHVDGLSTCPACLGWSLNPCGFCGYQRDSGERDAAALANSIAQQTKEQP